MTNKTYFLERSTGLETNDSFLPLVSNVVGQAGTTTFTDTNAVPAGPRLYRGKGSIPSFATCLS